MSARLKTGLQLTLGGRRLVDKCSLGSAAWRISWLAGSQTSTHRAFPVGRSLRHPQCGRDRRCAGLVAFARLTNDALHAVPDGIRAAHDAVLCAFRDAHNAAPCALRDARDAAPCRSSGPRRPTSLEPRVALRRPTRPLVPEGKTAVGAKSLPIRFFHSCPTSLESAPPSSEQRNNIIKHISMAGLYNYSLVNWLSLPAAISSSHFARIAGGLLA
jgi:hypothetical protein